MAWINRNCYVALEKAVEAAIVLVQPIGLDLREQALCLLVSIREVTAHGIHHGTAMPLLLLTFIFSQKWTCMRWSLVFIIDGGA
jgi:hypothetical protein